MADLPPATDVSIIESNHSASPVRVDLERSRLVISSHVDNATDAESQPDSVAKLKPGVVYPSASPDQELLLDGMNNDVLAMILDLLFDMNKPQAEWLYYDKPYFRHHSSTISLSLVNRRLRSVCIPKLFRNIFRLSTTMGQLNRQLKDIELDKAVLSSVR
jgi:hypothetical protein